MSQIKKYLQCYSLFTLLMWSNGNATTNDSIPKFKNFKLSRIVLTGNGYCGFDLHLNNKLTDSTGMTSTSTSIGLAPILLWKITPRLFFESEADFMMDHGMLSTEIGYANLAYNIPNVLTIQAGKFLSPFGMFAERYHPFWINSAPNIPLGFSHEGYSPEAELGLCLKRSFKRLNSSLYASTSPTMDAGNENIKNAGKIIYHTDWGGKINDKISIGGRLGILPIKNSSVELGISYKWMQLKPGDHYHGSTITHTHTSQANQPAFYIGNMIALDLTIQKVIPKVKGLFEIKAQANYINAGKNNFIKLSPSGKTEVEYSFLNISKFGFILLTYKPIFANKDRIKNAGIFVRGGMMQLPIGSLWYENTNELTLGINYSFSWHNILKIGYQQIFSAKIGYTNNIMIQWATGF